MHRTITVDRVPPLTFFFVSAVFHYLGPAFAVLLFSQLHELGVAWLRIASAALFFGLWRRPWRVFAGQSLEQKRNLIALGVVLGMMNSCFYLAIARLPLGTVGAIEFIGQIIISAIGVKSPRNGLAVLLALSGGLLLANVHLKLEPLGTVFAVANCLLFMLYIVLGHRIAQGGGAQGINRLGLAMLVALVTVFPLGIREALPAFSAPTLLLAAIGVGVCSSVIPYVCDQLAMARLPRATFALLLALLPVFATLIGAVVLGQIPSWPELGGILLIVVGVLVHQTKHT